MMDMEQKKQNKPKVEFVDDAQVIEMIKSLLLDQESLYDENMTRLDIQHKREMKQLELRMEEVKTERMKAELELRKFNRIVVAIIFSITSILVALIIAMTVLLYGTTFVIENGSDSVITNNSVGYIQNEHEENDTGYNEDVLENSFE